MSSESVADRILFYDAWISHCDAGFERSQPEADKLATMYGLDKAPPLADATPPMLQMISEIAGTPAGQVVITRLAEVLGVAIPEPLQPEGK